MIASANQRLDLDIDSFLGFIKSLKRWFCSVFPLLKDLTDNFCLCTILANSASRVNITYLVYFLLKMLFHCIDCLVLMYFIVKLVLLPCFVYSPLGEILFLVLPLEASNYKLFLLSSFWKMKNWQIIQYVCLWLTSRQNLWRFCSHLGQGKMTWVYLFRKKLDYQAAWFSIAYKCYRESHQSIGSLRRFGLQR